MLKILPLILISSTISLKDKEVFYLDNNYEIEGMEFLEKNKPKDSQNIDNILYDIISEQLIKEQFDLSHPK